ncbi:FkbM family methyltransferase [Nocardioides sp.]|uniref:FkbM family methyltransferase n=1 Tax=Nocardioides sp. TaxID=35761 RepID=UPI0031FF090F|nr:methyltransferase [Nocardioides sp.]
MRYDHAVFFVPDYAAHKPVAKKVLRKRRVTPPLHDLVAEVMALRSGSMVHAGAFFGDMLPSFSRKTDGLVYAFEPVVENYLLARAVMEANDLDNVVLLNAGLGDHAGNAWIETRKVAGGPHRGGMARIVDPDLLGNESHPVPMLTVDQLGIEDLSLIQLDVEGFELSVLRGAMDAIAVHRPVIVVEDSRGECAGLLTELGYGEVARLGLDHLYLTDADTLALAHFTERLTPKGRYRRAGG